MQTHTTEGAHPGQDIPDLRLFVFALFFIFGGITSLNDVLIPKLKELFTLSYAEVMTVQFAFFAAYFIISIPAAAIVKRVGYMRAAVIGLFAMMTGCLLFIPASLSAVFAMFLLALFVLASGITVIQVVTNPLISILGTPETAHSRLTFAQAFNSLGTTVFPYVGSILILGSLATVDPKTLTGVALDTFRRDLMAGLTVAAVAVPQAMAGKKCSECGAHAVIRKDGCDYCTQCGHLGSCG